MSCTTAKKIQVLRTKPAKNQAVLFWFVSSVGSECRTRADEGIGSGRVLLLHALLQMEVPINRCTTYDRAGTCSFVFVSVCFTDLLMASHTPNGIKTQYVTRMIYTRPDRVECVLQLKADTESAAALIRGANERRAAERLREEAEHEAEKAHLTTKGLNPYKASDTHSRVKSPTVELTNIITAHLVKRIFCPFEIFMFKSPTLLAVLTVVFFLEGKVEVVPLLLHFFESCLLRVSPQRLYPCLTRLSSR